MSDLEQIGWVLHLPDDGAGADNDAFWWSDRFPESPAAGAVPVYRERVAPTATDE